MSMEGVGEDRPTLLRPSSPSSSTSAIDARDVQNRRDLADYLNQSMSSQYREVVNGRTRQLVTYVKSYLVERHAADQTGESFGSVFPHSFERDDPSLVLLFDSAGLPYFLDQQDDRFVTIHTIAKTERTDKTIDRLTSGVVEGFDQMWFPSEFLLGTRRGALRGFNFRHQTLVSGIDSSLDAEEEASAVAATSDEQLNRDADDELLRVLQVVDGEPEPWNSPSRLLVRNSRTALSDYKSIRNHNIFGGRQALYWIQFVQSNQVGRYVTNGVYSGGKVIGNGTEIGIHLLNVRSILERYATLIRAVESDYAVGWRTRENSHRFQGEPLLIRFPEDAPILDLQSFAESVFSPAHPFRLFGIIHNASENRIDVQAIDLHTGHDFSCELTNEWMRIYLPVGSCANILARLLTNLQAWMTSDVELISGDGTMLFSEEDARAN